MGRLTYSLVSELRENYKLTDYPTQLQSYGRKISVVGIATRGCRIAYEISLQCKQLGNFLYLSCDEGDVVHVPDSAKKIIFQMQGALERSPSNVRGAVTPKLENVRKALKGSQLVFVVSGLGGTVGSGIAPLVAKCAKEIHAMVVGIVVMPFVFEKYKYFYAGCALRQLTESCDGIILLENETMLTNDQLSFVDSNARFCERVSLAINDLVRPIEKDGNGYGVETMVDYIRANPYTLLQVSEDRSLRTAVTGESYSRSGTLVTYQSREEVDAIIDSYDPIDRCLRRSSHQNLDTDLDSSVEIGQGILRNIEAC
jgi:Tubulin/FtsZ family, GTPase domain